MLPIDLKTIGARSYNPFGAGTEIKHEMYFIRSINSILFGYIKK